MVISIAQIQTWPFPDLTRIREGSKHLNASRSTIHSQIQYDLNSLMIIISIPGKSAPDVELYHTESVQYQIPSP